MKRLYLVLALAFSVMLLCQPSHAQGVGSGALRVTSRVYADSIVLRWAPAGPGLWRLYNRVGIRIERAEIGVAVPVFSTVANLIQPRTNEDLQQEATNLDTFSMVAVQCLYGRLSVPNLGSGSYPDPISAARDEFANRYSFALFAADMSIQAAHVLGLRFVDRNIALGKSYAYRFTTVKQDSAMPPDTTYLFVEGVAGETEPAVEQLTATEGEGRIDLSWRSPEGARHTAYHVDRIDARGIVARLSSRPIVLSADSIAQRSNAPIPAFSDTTCGTYRLYTYRVVAITPFAEESEPAVIQAMGRDRTPPSVPLVDMPVMVGERTVAVTWKHQAEADLKGYMVLRGTDPEGPWEPMSKSLLEKSQQRFLDTSAPDGLVYYVVLAGDTAGNYSESVPVYIDVHDTLPPAMPTNVRASMDQFGLLTVEWTASVSRDVMGYRVLWANDVDHEFSQLTNVVWKDTVLKTHFSIETLTDSLLVRVVAVDQRYFHSDASPNIVVRRPDIIPPTPSVITQAVSENGYVFLEYGASASTDVSHYRIERRLGGSQAWGVVGRGADVLRFEDRDVVHATVYEYRVVVVDTNGNASDPSQAVSVTARDVQRPYVPAQVRAVYDKKRSLVRVSWLRGNDDDTYVVFRRRQGGSFSPVASTRGDNEVLDRTTIGAGLYEYVVRRQTNLGDSDDSAVAAVDVP